MACLQSATHWPESHGTKYMAPPPSASCESLWYAPPPTLPVFVHSRTQPKPLPSVAACQSRDPVPPLWFLTTTMVCSEHRLQVCCNPSRTGFAAFYRAHRGDFPGKPEKSSANSSAPRDAFRTLQRFPLVDSRLHVTVRLCLPAVYGTCFPVRHLRPLETLRKQGLKRRSNESRSTSRTMATHVTSASENQSQPAQKRRVLQRSWANLPNAEAPTSSHAPIAQPTDDTEVPTPHPAKAGQEPLKW